MPPSPPIAEALRCVEPAAAVPDGGWLRLEWPPTGAEPHELVALRIAHRFAPGESYVREGWQSWSTPTPARVGAGVRRPATGPGPPRYGRRHWLADPPYAGDESHHLWRSASATAYVEPGHAAVFVADEEGLAVVRAEPADGAHPAVWFAPRAVDHGELATRLRTPHPVVRPHVGWTTWDAYGPDLRGDDLLDDLAIAERRLGDAVDVMIVDDGWQRVIGDWEPRDRRLAHALAAIADRRRLALWWAPFVVHRESALAAEHPGWILRDEAGDPVVVLARDEPWEAWALDLSDGDVVAWLADTAARLAGMGARLLKSDFLYASECTGDAARAGRCADPSLTGEQVHRRALAAIASSGAEIIGCGAPLWTTAGSAAVMRVGPDGGRRWRRPAPAGLEPQDAAGSMANAWAAAHRRHWMHGALWLNDPDSMYLHAGPRAAAWLDWAAGEGLPLVLGEPLATLGPTDRAGWQRAVERWREAVESGRWAA